MSKCQQIVVFQCFKLFIIAFVYLKSEGEISDC